MEETMKFMFFSKNKNFLNFLILIFAINAGANFIIVVFGNFIVAPHSYIQAEIARDLSDALLSDPFLSIIFQSIFSLSFVIPILLIFIHSFSIRRLFSPEIGNAQNLEVSKRRLLNMPLHHSLIGASGWIIGSLATYYVLWNLYSGFPWKKFIFIFLIQLCYAVFCFTLIYYTLEFVNRKFYIPRYFPENKLSNIQGVTNLSTKQRFLILYFTVSIFPVLLINLLFMGIDESMEMGKYIHILFIEAGIFFLGYFIITLVSQFYNEPLVKMKEAAESIGKGDFHIRIQVYSNDEIGLLAESLNQVAVDLKEKDFIKDTFGKIVDPKVRDYLLQGNLLLGGEIKYVTVLFSDIRGFSGIAEKSKPEELVKQLNQFFSVSGECITKYGGMVNKFIGDCIMAIFGAPLPIENQADCALNCSIEMIQARDRLNQKFQRQNLPEFQTGIGIHSGFCLLGNIGSSDRMEYTAIGDSVNTAARLESASKFLNHTIIFSEEVKCNLKNSYRIHSLGKIQVKGKLEPIQVYTVEI